MTQQLSAFKFIRNNKRQVSVIVLALSLTFMAMYVVNFILMVTEESFRPLFLDMPEKMTIAELSGDSLGISMENLETNEQYNERYLTEMNRLMEDLKKQEGIEECYYTQLLGVLYAPVIGNWWYDFPLLETEQIPDYLAHMGAKLVDGRMPEGDGEVLVDQKVLKNQHLKVGDVFMEENFGKKVFTVVGTLQSDCMVCVGTPNGYTNTGQALVILNDKHTSDLKALLRRVGRTVSDRDRIDDAVQLNKDYEKDVKGSIAAATSAILLVVVTFLAIAVFVTYISFMRNRVNEWCLYTSIGYSRKDIYGLIMREIVMIFGASIIFGSATSVLVMEGLAKGLIAPLGLSYAFWYPFYFMRLISTYIFLIGLLQIPILIIIHRIRTIDKMED